jgi:hypothetical protein
VASDGAATRIPARRSERRRTEYIVDMAIQVLKISKFRNPGQNPPEVNQTLEDVI